MYFKSRNKRKRRREKNFVIDFVEILFNFKYIILWRYFF